jgi:NADH-quinone oxidoreductase subunit M
VGADAWQLKFVTLLALSGVVLGAWYMLYLVQRIFFGPLREPAHHDAHSGQHGEATPIHDLSWREIAALAPLAVLALWIGLRPADWLSPLEPSLKAATTDVVRVLQANDATHVAPGVSISQISK